MTISLEEAKANVHYLYETYLPSYPFSLDFIDEGFDGAIEVGIPVDEWYAASLSLFSVNLGRYSSAFPEHPATTADYANKDAYLESIPSSEIVDFYYPNASSEDRGALVAQLDANTLSVVEFLQGWTIVSQADSTPSAASVIAASSDSFDYVPEAELSFPGVTADQLDFLTAVYVGSFNRAPRYEGLKYWAGDLADALQNGVEVGSAFSWVIANMYQAGTENGEMGSDMNNSEYVTFLYHNALGRAPEQAGHDYWVERLDDGTIPRNVFLHTFLVAALEHPENGDATYITSRIEVAQFAAQEHISGIGTNSPDPFAVLEGVRDPSTARLAINELVDEYGPPPAEARYVNSFWIEESVTEAPIPEFSYDHADQVDLADLVGVSVGDGAEMLIL